MASTATIAATLFPSQPKPRKPEIPKKPLQSVPLNPSSFPLTLHSTTPTKPQFSHFPHSTSHTPTTETETPLKHRVFLQDPPWINALSFKTDTLQNTEKPRIKLKRNDIDKREYNALRRRQIREETEVWERSVEEYRQLQKEMRERRLAPNLPCVKALFFGWFEPLRDAIGKEQEVQKGKPKRLRAAYAPFLGLLPADKMAVIVMHKVMGLVMTGDVAEEGGCVTVVQAAVQIGVAIEQEVIELADS